MIENLEAALDEYFANGGEPAIITSGYRHDSGTPSPAPSSPHPLHNMAATHEAFPTTVEAGVDFIIKLANEDYDRFMPESRNAEMNAAFKNGWTVSTGKKYIKIVNQNSVWGFVVNTHSDNKFNIGDILKPASFNAPARNFARGNVRNGDLNRIRWTSAG